MHSVRTKLGAIVAACAFAGIASGAPQPIRYSVVEIPAPEDPACVPGYQRVIFARRMNETAVAVGTDRCYAATGDPTAPFLLRGDQAFRWSARAGATRLPSIEPNAFATIFGTANLTPLQCLATDPNNGRAIYWCEDGVADLNARIPRALAREILLVNASAINDRGQILVRGIRRNEAPQACPFLNFDPETGEPFYDTTATCQNEYSFLLTPVQAH